MEYPAFSVVDETTILNYEANGVVCLRGMIHPRWVDLAREGVQRNLKYPGKFFRDHTPEGSRGRYVFDFWTWPDIPEFRKIIFDSPLAGVAGELMRSQYINLVMDNWFMREAGATNAAPWHHDEPYFDFDGKTSREDYWMFTLWSFVITVIFAIVSAGLLGAIYSIFILFPQTAINVRR